MGSDCFLSGPQQGFGVSSPSFCRPWESPASFPTWAAKAPEF